MFWVTFSQEKFFTSTCFYLFFPPPPKPICCCNFRFSLFLPPRPLPHWSSPFHSLGLTLIHFFFPSPPPQQYLIINMAQALTSQRKYNNRSEQAPAIDNKPCRITFLHRDANTGLAAWIKTTERWNSGRQNKTKTNKHNSLITDRSISVVFYNLRSNFTNIAWVIENIT